MPDINLVSLQWNDAASKCIETRDLFSGGVCSWCGSGIGERNKTSITCSLLPKSDFADVHGLSPFTPIVSDKLREILKQGSNGKIKFRPVETTSKKVQSFFEIINDSKIDVVAVKGLFYKDSSIVCPKCGRWQIMNLRAGKGFVEAIRKNQIPDEKCFLAGSHNKFGFSLWADKAWWKMISRRDNLKGVVAGSAIAVDDAEIISNPKLGKYEKDECRKKGRGLLLTQAFTEE